MQLIHMFGKMCTIYPSVFNITEVVNELRRLHDNSLLVPAYKASNKIVFVCRNYYHECLMKWNLPNPTYTRTNLTKNEILQNHLSVLILSTSLKIKISLIYPTFIGFQNYTKILTNKDTMLAPVNVLLSHYRTANGYIRVTPLHIPEVVSII
jgi:hypothetical protein